MPFIWYYFDCHSQSHQDSNYLIFHLDNVFKFLLRQTLQTTFSQRIQVAEELCSWPSWIWECLVKDGVLSIHDTNTSFIDVWHTWRGKGRCGEEHTDSDSHSKLRPPGQFPTSGLKISGDWNLPGPQVSMKSPLDSLPCGTGAMWQTQQLHSWGREGRGSTKEANLGYLPQGGPLGRRNAIAFGIQVTSHLHGVTGFPLLNVLIHGGFQKVGVFAFGFPHSDHSLFCGPHKNRWLCWLHICPHFLKHGNFRPLAGDRSKAGIKFWLLLALRSAHTLTKRWV